MIHKLCFYFINKFDEKINYLDKNIHIIYRNYDNKHNIDEIIKIQKTCKLNRRKFFLANNLKLAIYLRLDGVYIPSFNQELIPRNINNKPFFILGSAHNLKELNLKLLQGCENILISRLFKTDYSYKNDYMGLIKFNFFSKIKKGTLSVLGGVRLSNLNKLKLVNSNYVAILSEVKKKPAISSRLF